MTPRKEPLGKKRTKSDYLEPLRTKKKSKPFATLDIESKGTERLVGDKWVNQEGFQEAGFTRPFLAGLYDPQERWYESYRNDPHLAARGWEAAHSAPGSCIDKLLTRCLSKQFNGYIFYAHYGGSFDFLHFLKWLRLHQDDFIFEVVPIQSSIQVIRVSERRDDENDERPIMSWEFLDSFKLLPFALKTAAAAFGVTLKIQHDLDLPEDDPSWDAYQKGDCVTLAEIVGKARFLLEDDAQLGGEVGITAPSTAMKLFRRRHLGEDNVPEKIARYRCWPGCDLGEACGGCYHEWIRRAYYGGRTEVFNRYGENVHYYDINSSYVAAMLEWMPVGKRYVEYHPKKVDFSRLSQNWGGFAECTVYIPPDCPIPPLPHPRMQGGKLLFPTGQFHGVWDVEELALLSEPMVKGEIRHVTRVSWHQKVPMFEVMVRKLWRLRNKSQLEREALDCKTCAERMALHAGEEGPSAFDPCDAHRYSEGLSLLAKLLGNSCYGKFGMKHERQTIAFAVNREDGDHRCSLCEEPVMAEGKLCDDCVGSKPATDDPLEDVWYQRKYVDAPYIIPHVAAHITTLGRIALWKFMKQSIELGGELLYVDTDSVLTTATMPSGSRLGELKDEYPGRLLRWLGAGPKCYMIEDMTGETVYEKNARGEILHSESKKYGKRPRTKLPKVTMKGFPAEERFPENLERLLKGQEIEWRQLEKVRSLARKGFRTSPKMRKVKKSFKSPYDKRILMPDGSTRAHVLREPMGGYALEGERDEAAE